MKKTFAILTLLLFAGVYSAAQKKNGTVYAEHELIDNVESMWDAMAKGDLETYRSFFADSVYIVTNDEPSPRRANSEIFSGIKNFVDQYDNFKVMTQPGSYPDAIEYKDGQMWVQEWKVLTGIHKETGIHLDLPMHSLYAFTEDGKIGMLARYFDNDVFEEIGNSQRKIENGKVYINHPYIVTARKTTNALVAKDYDTWASYYAPNARIHSAPMPMDQSVTIEEAKASMQEMYGPENVKMKVEQVGYPDCVWYAKNDMHVVYSWWKVSLKVGDKYAEFPVMISQDFNKEGKIVFENQYFSNNHMAKVFE